LVTKEFAVQTEWLDKQDAGAFGLYVITDSRLMRGYDYRAPKKGLTLFVATSFESRNAFRQGMNRVGRFGDEAHRCTFVDLPEVDTDKEKQNQVSMYRSMGALKKPASIVIKGLTCTRKRSKPVQRHDKPDSG
jgi:hypothetical protein